MALVGDYISLSSPISVTFWRNFKSGSYPSLCLIRMIRSQLWQLTGWPLTSTGAAAQGPTSMWHPAMVATPRLSCKDHWRWRQHLSYFCSDVSAYIWCFHGSSQSAVIFAICFYKCSRSKFIYSLFLWCKQTSKLLSVKFSHLQVLVHI